MNQETFYRIVEGNGLKVGYLAMVFALGILALSIALGSCAPAQPVWEEEGGANWRSLGSGTYWTTIRPVMGSTQECVVVYTSGPNNRAVSVDCY